MIVVCNNYVSEVRFKKSPSKVGYHEFNFHLNPKYGIRNDNKHKRFAYFGESYMRFDKKCNKIKSC